MAFPNKADQKKKKKSKRHRRHMAIDERGGESIEPSSDRFRPIPQCARTFEILARKKRYPEKKREVLQEHKRGEGEASLFFLRGGGRILTLREEKGLAKHTQREKGGGGGQFEAVHQPRCWP